MESWTGTQRAFAVKAFYKNGDSFMIAQREFRRELGIHRNRAVPSAHAIKTWVRNFEATGSALKKKGGCVKTVRTPKNIAAVRDAIERIHTVLRVATLCHSGCLKPAFDGFYTTTFLLYIYTYTHTHVYIYIYIYVCVCVCLLSIYSFHSPEGSLS